MFKFRYIMGVIFVAAVSVFFSSIPDISSAKNNEAYNWGSYNTIYASQGQYEEISDENGRVVFTQDTENPYLFTSDISSDTCKTKLSLTVSESNASDIKITNSGGCPAATKLSGNSRVTGSTRALAMVQGEEEAIRRAHLEAACSIQPEDAQSENTQAQTSASETSADPECPSAASERFKEEQGKCITSNNYRDHIVKSDAYLECLATALDVDRPSSEDKNENEAQEPRSCQIAGIGWIVCQLTELIAQITDNTFSLLQPFLELEPLSQEVSTGGDSATYKAWKSIRDLANILLAAGLLFIVFSHLSGIGVQAYHIKKSMPRLIVASLLINTSFFISAALVDVSNITGKAIQDTTRYFPTLVTSQSDEFSSWEDTATTITSITPTDEEFTKRAAGITNDEESNPEDEPAEAPESAGGGQSEDYKNELKDTVMKINGIEITGIAVLYANLSILVPVMVFALFAMFAALMVLLFRQVLVIVLIVISPLAFAALMLSGTKRWYDKWQSTLVQLLMLYPIIALIYAGSQIAADAVRDSAANSGHTLIAIFSLGIQVIPLFVTPLLLKFSGGAMNRFAGAVQGISTAPRKAAMSKATEYRKQRKQIRNARWQDGRVFGGKIKIPRGEKVAQALPHNIINAYKTGRRFRQDRIESDKKRHLYDNMDTYLENINDENINSDMKASAAADVFDINTSNVSAEESVLEMKGVQKADLMQMATTGKDGNGKEISEDRQRAAVKLLMRSATPEDVHQLLIAAGSGNLPIYVSQDIASEANRVRASSKSFEISQTVLGGAASGNIDMNQAMISGIKSGRLKPADVPLQDASTLERARSLLADPSITEEERASHVKKLVKGIVSENAGSTKNDTMEIIARTINEQIGNGTVTMEEVVSILATGNRNDKTNAFLSLLSDRASNSNQSLKDFIDSTSFNNELASDPTIGDTLFEAGINNTLNAVAYTAYDVETLNFHMKHLTSSLQNILSYQNRPTGDLDRLKKFVTAIKTSSHLAKDSAERQVVADIISAYNTVVPPGDRV